MKNKARNTISEAFDELYKELIKEDITDGTPNPSAVDTDEDLATLSPLQKVQANKIIARAKRYGGNSGLDSKGWKDENGAPHNFDGPKGEQLFSYVMEKLVEEYIDNRDPKVEDSIIAAIYPKKGTKIYNALIKKWGRKMNSGEVEDAIASGFARVVSEKMANPGVDKNGEPKANFLELVNSDNGDIASYLYASLDKSIISWFEGYKGGSSKDSTIANQAASYDDTDDDSVDMLDKIRNPKDDSDALEVDAANREGLVHFVKWFEDSYEEGMTKPQYKHFIAWQGMMDSKTKEEVYKEFPQYFKTEQANFKISPEDHIKQNIQAIGKYAYDFTQSPVTKQISSTINDILKNKYPALDIDFDVSKGKKQDQFAAQDYSTSYDYSPKGERGSVEKKDTPEIRSTRKELQKLLKPLGFTDDDFNSVKQVDAIIANLMDMESPDYELTGAIKNASDNYESAKDSAREKGLWGTKRTEIPIKKTARQQFSKGETDAEFAERQRDKRQPWEKDFSGMFEGVNTDTLIERVMKRISK